jgi:hypothetical protein
MKAPSISKSKYLNGLQCPKLLWAQYNAKDWFPTVDAATEAIFEQGHKVGDLAKQRFPGGVEVAWTGNFADTITQTRDLLSQRKPIFEASFSAGGVYARADILKPVPRGQWDIIEVKSTTEVKDVHLDDLSVQKHCYESAGLSIRRCYLMHIDRTYVLKGDVDAAGLFAQEDVTSNVAEKMKEVKNRVVDMLKVIGKADCPEMEIGPHCSDPYDCPLSCRCWKKINSIKHSIFTLYRLGGKAWQLYNQGVLRNSGIGEAIPLSDLQRIQINAEASGDIHIRKPEVKRFLKGLKYPLAFLDFETFSTPIPVVQGTRPYQQVPFQFSLHIVDTPNSTPTHISWIWDGNGDPFAVMLKTLRESLTRQGAIISYNSSFECSRLKEAAARCPGYNGWVADVLERMVDLLVPFRAFDIYHPDQNGSASIKSVLPVLTGKGYSDLAIGDGGTASAAYLAAMYGGVSAQKKQKTLKDLEEYCGLDTLGMWDIIKSMGKLVAKN